MIRPDFLLDLLVSLNLSIRKNHPSPSVTPVIEQIANASQSLLRRNAWLARKLSRAARWGTRAEARMRVYDPRAFPAGIRHSPRLLEHRICAFTLARRARKAQETAAFARSEPVRVCARVRVVVRRSRAVLRSRRSIGSQARDKGMDSETADSEEGMNAPQTNAHWQTKTRSDRRGFGQDMVKKKI